MRRLLINIYQFQEQYPSSRYELDGTLGVKATFVEIEGLVGHVLFFSPNIVDIQETRSLLGVRRNYPSQGRSRENQLSQLECCCRSKIPSLSSISRQLMNWDYTRTSRKRSFPWRPALRKLKRPWLLTQRNSTSLNKWPETMYCYRCCCVTQSKNLLLLVLVHFEFCFQISRSYYNFSKLLSRTCCFKVR